MLRTPAIVLLTVISFAALSSAQPKPNYSGNWKLNVAKSEFGILPAPKSETAVIDHKDPALKMDMNVDGAQGENKYIIDTDTNGKEIVVRMGIRDVKMNAVWEGQAVVLNSKVDYNGQEIIVKNMMNLSSDGQILTQNLHMTSAMGEVDQKLVFEKQSGDMPMKTVEAPKAIAPTPAISSGPKPNLSGVWILNVAKSDFGVIPGPESRMDKIEHSEPALKLTVQEKGGQGDRTYALNLTNDGKETTVDASGLELKITNTWEGSALVSMIKLKIQEQDINIKQVTTLSADGKTLTNKNHIVSAMGEMDQTEIYEKQQ